MNKAKQERDIIESIKDNELISLKECIRDIDTLIKVRGGLHQDILRSIESVKSDINSFIMRIDNKTPEVLQEIVKLKQQQVNLDQFKLQERVNEWRDIAELKRERRERDLELREIENRAELFEGI